MAKLLWDQTGEKQYETGLSNGAVYVMAADGTYGNGVAWNGLMSLSESPSGAEPTKLYANNSVYLTMTSVEEFSASIEAYMSPVEFDVCDGQADIAAGVSVGQQTRRGFGLVYKTKIGNDVSEDAFGYKLHILYGCKVTPSQKSYQTINDSPEANTLSWEVSTTPVPVEGFKNTSTIVIDSTKIAADKLALLEDKLYGTESTEATFLLPSEVLAIVSPTAVQG